MIQSPRDIPGLRKSQQLRDPMLGSKQNNMRKQLRGLDFDQGKDLLSFESEGKKPQDKKPSPKNEQPFEEERIDFDEPRIDQRIDQRIDERIEEDPELAWAKTACKEYDKVKGGSGAKAFQLRFAKLQQWERAIYKWFSVTSSKHQMLSGHGKTGAMKGMLADCENEHLKLVDKSKNMREVLPFDSSHLKGEELSQAQELWQSIVNSRGNIKLGGSGNYRRRVLSELGKILSTETGSQMLAFLNTPVKSQGESKEPIPLSQIFIGESLTDVPEELSKGSMLHDKKRSEAQPLGKQTVDKHQAIDRGSKERDERLPKLGDDPKGHFKAVVGGERGYRHGDQTREFSPGVGSFVTSYSGHATNVDKDDHEVLTPGWVTLGHELGHSTNMKAGATTLTDKANDKPSELFKSQAKGKGGAEIYDNAEEFFVIENVENGLRRESGQRERQGHHPPEWAIQKAIPLKAAVMKPLSDLKNSTEGYRWNNIPEFKELYSEINELEAEVVGMHPEVLAPLKTKVDKLLDEKNKQRLIGKHCLKRLGDAIDDPGLARKLVDKLSPEGLTKVFDWLWQNKEKAACERLKRALGLEATIKPKDSEKTEKFEKQKVSLSDRYQRLIEFTSEK